MDLILTGMLAVVAIYLLLKLGERIFVTYRTLGEIISRPLWDRPAAGRLFTTTALVVYVFNNVWSVVFSVAVFATAFSWGIRDGALICALALFAVCSVLFILTGAVRSAAAYQLALEMRAVGESLTKVVAVLLAARFEPNTTGRVLRGMGFTAAELAAIVPEEVTTEFEAAQAMLP
jgi:hypothetical protein